MVAASLAAIAAVGVVIVAALVFRKLGRDVEEDDGPGEEIASHVGAMLSALFLLAFALAIVVPWTTADSAGQNAQAESQAVVAAHWAAERLPAPTAEQLQTQLRDYAQFVVDKEWPMMAEGQLSNDGWTRLDALRTQVTDLQVAEAEAQDAKSELLMQLQNISSSRHQRAADAVEQPPPVVLLLTTVTGVAVILFPFFGGSRIGFPRLVPVIVMAALLGVAVYLAFDISHAFTGGLAVGPDAFEAALQELQRVQGGT